MCGLGELPKDGVAKLVMSGLLRVVIDADGQDCCHGEVSFIESYREGMAGETLAERASASRSSSRNSIVASRMRSECDLRCGYLALRASNSSSESLGGKKARVAVGS